MRKPHNPTPEERDERFSLYGLDPKEVGESILNASAAEHDRKQSPPPKRKRKPRRQDT